MRERETLTLAICSDEPDAPQTAREVARSLSRAMGQTVLPLHLPTYAGLHAALESGIAAVGLVPPMVALDLERWGAAVPLAAAQRKGRTHYRAALAVRAGGPATIAACRGARVAWVSKLSAAGYVVPRLYLESQGIDPDAHFAAQTFSQSHAAALAALARGDADVAATYVLAGASGDVLAHPDGAMVLLAAIGPVPTEVVMANPALGGERLARLAASFVALEGEGRAALARTFEIDGFAAASGAHLDPLRALLQRARTSAPPGCLAALA